MKQCLCRRAALSAATPRFARRPATPAAASSVASIAHSYRRSLRPCLATPIAPLRRAPLRRVLLEEHDPGASRAAGTVLVLRGATPAIPVLPPDPLQVLYLEQEKSKDPEKNRRLRHPRTVAYDRAARNGPPGSSFRRMRPTSAERRRGHRSRR